MFNLKLIGKRDEVDRKFDQSGCHDTCAKASFDCTMDAIAYLADQMSDFKELTTKLIKDQNKQLAELKKIVAKL